MSVPLIEEIKHEEVTHEFLQEVFEGISSEVLYAKTCDCKGCGNAVSFMMSFSYATATAT